MAASVSTGEDAEEDAFTLDCLPFDCIVTICEYLPAEDLARMSRVCTTFHDAAQVGYLWRQHSLSRWLFCDVLQISEGPQRWMRYFLARRRVEARIDTGRPGRDYRVRTLRGHESDIVSAVVMSGRGGGGDVDWENPAPPVVVSLSDDGCVKAWDVIQGKAVWSLEGENISSLAACESRGEVALGRQDGSVQLWETGDWSPRATFHTSSTGNVTALQYGSITARRDSKLPNTFLIVHSLGGQLEVWDPEAVVAVSDESQVASPVKPVKPVLELWSPTHIGRYRLSSYGLLCVEAGFGDVHVFDLPSLSLTDTPPLPPHVTLHTNDPVTTSCWVEPRCLATVTQHSVNVDLWNIGSHLDALTRAKKSLYDQTSMYSPTRSIPNELPAVCVGVANELLITGDGDGCVRVHNPKSGEQLQKFQNHKGTITDLRADAFRVLTCSKDFSMRVYRWLKAPVPGRLAQLESRYTLLGGSVALKTHDGFRQLLCEASSCVGVAGNQLKFYTFSTKLEPSP